MRAAVIVLLAVITGFALGAGVTVWVIRESDAGQFGFVSTETTATLLAAQETELEERLGNRASNGWSQDSGTPDGSNSKQLTSLKTQVSQLTSQLAAMNRDLASLRFRVDTHSDSFRPLIQNDPDSRIRPAAPGQ
ncbi:hypothetical protein [Sulfuriroseicoccus oceanibius]|uniref:Uncharacterized protein n=1 Tax=Sulfuriroseicoccus oceanibius TaxID=2707525 RepID=A0A6B3L858_9BACT|nr:hypothetical protein [Sulfuriroseicoccus oceanibius]QQL43701.1 hypothetical protein G3M56_007250 [Sulfuriroseicoccus oceanibius]